MSTKIKGLTIEIGGSTVQLQKSMSEVNKKSKDLQSELASVNRLLKLDPKNTDLIAQKQKILADAVSATSEKLEKLKEAERQVTEQFKRGEASEEAVRELQRTIVRTEQDLKKLTAASEQMSDTISRKFKDAGKSMQDFGGKVTNAGKSLAPVSTAAGAAVGGIIAMGVKAGQSADEINTLAKQTGLSTEEIQKFMYASERIDVPLETFTGSMAKLTRSMGNAQKGTKSTQAVFDELGVSWDDGTGKLRDNEEVFYDLINSLAEVENATERDRMSMELFGRSAQDLNPLILGGADALKTMGEEADKSGLILSQEALDAANEFNDAIDKLKADTTGSFAKVGTEIATALTPVLNDLAETIGRVLDWFSKLDEDTIKIILGVLGFVAVLAPLLIVIGQVITAVGAITTALPALGGALAFLAGPVGIVIAIIAALIAIGVALYKNWDTIKAAAVAMYESIKESFNKTKDAIVTPITNAIDTLKKINLFEIGKNIISGLIDGVKAMIAKVKETIGNIAETITGGIKKALKIQSPSRVMEGLGEYTGEGLIKGLESTKRALSSVSNSMGSVATAGAGAGSMMHSGTIRVEGINDKNQLVGVADIVMEQLRREARRR